MRRVRRTLLVIAALAVGLLTPAQAQRATPRIWFCPGPGTLDYLRLFEHPEEWRHARPLVSVFKFYQQHTLMPPADIVGPNTYEAFARAGAFRQLRQWRIQTAIEVAAVKEFFCTPDARGMNESIAATIASVRAIEAAGGAVSYLAMDEPFVSGRARACGGPALEPTADRVATYIKGVRSAFPNIQIGLIEAYPFSSGDALQTIVDVLAARGVPPAFLHIDVDLAAMRPTRNDFTRDMRGLRDVARARGILFGIIIWGNNGDADPLYALDASRLVESVTAAFPSWNDMPDHIIVQSWAESRTGLRITPTNLPDDRAFTHTNLLWNIFRRLRGQSGAASGTASRGR
jgi:hypothetical protein